MATIRWCPIFPKWDIYQPLIIYSSTHFHNRLLYPHSPMSRARDSRRERDRDVLRSSCCSSAVGSAGSACCSKTRLCWRLWAPRSCDSNVLRMKKHAQKQGEHVSHMENIGKRCFMEFWEMDFLKWDLKIIETLYMVSEIRNIWWVWVVICFWYSRKPSQKLCRSGTTTWGLVWDTICHHLAQGCKHYINRWGYSCKNRTTGWMIALMA